MNNDDWRRGTREAENRAVSRTPMRDFAHLWNLSGINVTRVRGREERGGAGVQRMDVLGPGRAMRPWS